MRSGLFSAILFVLALALALAYAPSLEPTAAGVIALALVPVLLSGVVVKRPERRSLYFGFLVSCTGLYVAWVASRSAVIDYGRNDGLLLGCGLAACGWAGWLARGPAHRVAAVGVALLGLANVGVALIQWKDPSFTPIYAGRETLTYPSGFYAHYNHFADFLLGCGFLAAGSAVIPGGRRWIRCGWAAVALACLGGICLSQSRGAYLATGVGGLALTALWLLDLNRRRVKWFGIALIGALALLPAAGYGAWQFTRIALKDRGVESDSARMLDDSGRLDFASMAIELASEHPLTGGGSRSFSYEVFQKWDPKEMWVGSGDIDMVHNEPLQAAADYGWIGLGLLLLLIFSVVARGMMCMGIEPPKGAARVDFGLMAGALAGIVAMLTQGLFSFVFHMVPDVILLALMIGMVVAQPWPFFHATAPGLCGWSRPAPWMGGTLAVVLGLIGWRDAAAWWLIARPGASGYTADAERRYQVLQQAHEIRPDFRIEQAMVEAAGELAQTDPDPVNGVWPMRILDHQRSIVGRHPWNYISRLGLATRLDELGRLSEAEEHYRQLLPLLDTREMFYHARFAYGGHAFRRAYAFWKGRRASEAMAWALEAQSQMEASRKNAVFDAGRSAESKKVDDFIKWLVEAHVAPEPGVVPELK
jgi:O-antigen ligase